METLNGVDLAAIQQYQTSVKNDAAQGRATFIARSSWLGGTRSAIQVGEMRLAGANAASASRSFELRCDEPPQLGGEDSAPNPVELLAAGLCGCLTAGIATNAALFHTALEKLDVEVRCDWDMRGVLGLDKSIPNHALGIHYQVTLKGKPGVSEAQLEQCKAALDRKSAILHTLLNEIPATTSIRIEP
ncbi:OsmC family protein [Chromobacterium sp. IIBBL 290-4]|uniref:OsmC family protein n=1 Tax=Chromobacterium sp. IIBBL 290-4 TaxID=2953890 RepID=UPI0020B77E96|nr:OsmC family protein [Chromobacterium sp. IIBBL 290-4]UTH74612.1 OsmC family protein [Chromobacterium sp. IIBBL 290-4]